MHNSIAGYLAVISLLAGNFVNNAASVKVSLEFLTKFDIDKPAFITTFPSSSSPLAKSQQSKSYDLIISSFGVGLRKSPDAVREIKDISTAIKQKKFVAEEVKDSVIWPNEVSVIGDDVVVPGGFLVPGKKGHVSTMKLSDFQSNPSQAKWTRLVSGDSGFFHRVAFFSIKGKGNGQQLISCRGRKGFVGTGGGEMVYFEKTEGGSYETKTVFPGCDCFFEMVDLNGDGVMEFIIPEFFSSRLVLMWTEDPDGDYTKTNLIRTRVIEDQIGKLFDIQLVDLDNDGQLDILATNHESSKKEPLPSLVSYKITLPTSATSNFNNGEQLVFSAGGDDISKFMNGITFTKKVLSSNFPVLGRGIQAAAPGSARAVIPHATQWKHAPVILVSGDDAEKAYLLYKVNDTDYEQVAFHDCQGTVGTVHARDVDGDGWLEVFVACYSKNYVAVYKFKMH